MATQQQIDKLEKELINLKEKLKAKQEKVEWIDIGNGKEISTKQMHNGKTYSEILKLLNKGEKIADYPLLQELRNSGKFEFLKKFWIFVPNPDNISVMNGYVARFSADSRWVDFDCYWNDSSRNASLGVFIVRKIKRKEKNA